MRTKKRAILTCCATATLALLLTAGCASNTTQSKTATPADLVFTNGKVYTVEEALVGDGTEKIDLGGEQALRPENSIGRSRCCSSFSRPASNASKFIFPQLGFP